MKYLIMCEGPNELEIINILLDHDLLKISRDDLLNLSAYHARQIDKSAIVQLALNLYFGEITVWRIGDGLTEKFRVPEEYKNRIVVVEKYCTKPELEMLLIISENLKSEYDKVKSSVKPKIFAKKRIKIGKKRYDNSTEFYADYFSDRPELLVDCIIKYKQQQKAHAKDEGYLADVLKS